MNDFLTWIVLGLPAFILAGTVHEYMHAWTAKRLGDYTAATEGRLSFNPLVHLDPWGLLLMVFARFGWMKPVPVNEYNFEKPVLGMALTAAAGPVSNLFMAIVTSVIFRLFFDSAEATLLVGNTNLISAFLSSFLYIFIWVNLALMLFNLIPLPPLDGFRIVRVFFPQSMRYYWESLENYSIVVLLLLFLPFSPLSSFTGTLLFKGIQFFLNLLI